MASDIMQQVQEDSRKKKQQGVLSRLSSTAPRSAGVGGYGTPEPTVVEKAKEVQEEAVVEEPASKQTARRLAADLREDGTTTESWEAARQEVADRGARYRESLQSPKGDQTPTEMEASYDKEKEFQTQDYGDAGILRSEKISQYDLIEDDETGLPSKTYREALVRNAKQMDIPNLDKFLSIMDVYEKSAGLQKAAKTETELTIARDTAEDATKQLRQLFPNIGNLEDAAIKDSIIKSNIVDRDAAETFFPETRGTGFSMDGSDVEDAVSRIKKQREDAQKRLDAQNQKVVKGAADTIKRTGRGGTTPKQPTAAQKAAALALQKERARAGVSDDFVGPIQPESISENLGESESSTDLEYEPEESGEETVEETDRRVVQEVVSREPTISKVLPGPDSSVEERQQWARLRPEVKSEAMKNVVQPMTRRIDDMYESVGSAGVFASKLSNYFRTVGGDPTTPEVNIQTLTARSPYQYYKTLPLSVKRNLDLQALEALEFFRKNNKGRGYPRRSSTAGYGSADDTPEAKLRHKLNSYKRILERRVRTGDYETSEELPGKFSEGKYLPIPMPIGKRGSRLPLAFETTTPAYSKDVPLEAQEDVYQDSPVEDIIASAAGE